MEIKPGDVVRLRSGGPVMTVEFIDGGNKANCIYFCKDRIGRKLRVDPKGLDVIRSGVKDWDAWVVVNALLQDPDVLSHLNTDFRISDAKASLEYLNDLFVVFESSNRP